MKIVDLIQTENYPNRLSWKELNAPKEVIDQFLRQRDLHNSLFLLRKINKQVVIEQIQKEEISDFLINLEKLLQALYISRLKDLK